MNINQDYRNKRKRHCISRKDKPVAKHRPNPVLKPHFATCTCSGSVVTTVNEVPEDDSTSTEDDAVTGTDADNSEMEPNLPYFGPKRVGAAPIYTDLELSPKDISSESERSTFNPNQEK